MGFVGAVAVPDGCSSGGPGVLVALMGFGVHGGRQGYAVLPEDAADFLFVQNVWRHGGGGGQYFGSIFFRRGLSCSVSLAYPAALGWTVSLNRDGLASGLPGAVKAGERSW